MEPATYPWALHTLETARCPSPSCPIHITHSHSFASSPWPYAQFFECFVFVFLSRWKKLSQLDAIELDRCVWAGTVLLRQLVPLEPACKLLQNLFNCQVPSQMIRLEMVSLQPSHFGATCWALPREGHNTTPSADCGLLQKDWAWDIPSKDYFLNRLEENLRGKIIYWLEQN